MMTKTVHLALALMLMSASAAFGQATVTVTNENLTGPGSLAQAIQDVDPGGTILFDAGVSWIEMDSVGVITKNLMIDGSDKVILSNSLFGQQTPDSLLLISGAEVEIRDTRLITDSFDAVHSIVIEHGGSLTLRSANYASEWGATIKVGQDSYFEAIDSGLGGYNLGQAPGGVVGDGSALIRFVNCGLGFDGPGISVNSGRLEIISSRVSVGDQVDALPIINDGAEVLIQDSGLHAAFTNRSGSYTIQNSSLGQFGEGRPLTQIGGSGKLIQSDFQWSDPFEYDPNGHAVECLDGSMEILNSMISEKLEYTASCELDVFSTVVTLIAGPNASQFEAPELFNYLWDKSNPLEDPRINGGRLYADSPLIDQGSCSRLDLTEDHLGNPRPFEAPKPNASGGDACDIGHLEKQGPLLFPEIRLQLQGGQTAGLTAVLPLESPFSLAPWNYNGLERVEPGFFEANPDIIDWVLFELRRDPAVPTRARAAGFLKEDGSVVGIDGVSPPFFFSDTGQWHMVVYQRNHLAVISPLLTLEGQ